MPSMPMTELVRFLSLNRNDNGDKLLTSVDEIIEAGYLRSHIVKMLRDNGDAGLVGSADAYLHPNGFVKICVAKAGEWSVRLHFWNQSEEESHIHSHRWDFASRLLIGSLQAKTFEVSSEEARQTMFYCRRTLEDGYLFEDAGPCATQIQHEDTYRQGISYFQDHRLLHTVETVGLAPIITAVVQGADVSDQSIVIASRGEEPPKQLPLLPLEASQIRPLLEQALELL